MIHVRQEDLKIELNSNLEKNIMRRRVPVVEGRVTILVDIENIISLEAEDKNIYIVYDDFGNIKVSRLKNAKGESLANSSVYINNVLKMFSRHRLMQVNRGIVVNTRYIRKLDNSNITLTMYSTANNGYTVAISRRHLASVRALFK